MNAGINHTPMYSVKVVQNIIKQFNSKLPADKNNNNKDNVVKVENRAWCEICSPRVGFPSIDKLQEHHQLEHIAKRA